MKSPSSPSWKFRPWLLLCLALAGCAHRRTAREMRQFEGSIIEQPLTEPVLAQARPGVVALEALDDQGQVLGYGTGFYIGPEQVVTCMHVIESGSRLQIVLSDRTRHEVAGIFGTDLLLDTAVLWVTTPPPDGKVLRLRDRPAAVGETAYLLAAPRQLPITASKGAVLELRDLGSDLLNQAVSLSVPAVPGFSGGPVLDAEGAVIGVLSQVYSSAAGRTSVAVPVGEIRGLADAPGEPLNLWRERNPPLDPRAAAALHAGESQGPGQETLALAYYNRALTLAPNCTRAWVRKGFLLFRRARHADAAGAFRRALAFEPGLVTPRLFLSMCLGLNRQYADALDEAHTVIAQRPRSVFAQVWLATAQLGASDPWAALASLRQAEELAPDQPLTHNVFGKMWDSLGCPAAAEKQFREAIRLQPRTAAVRANLAAILLESGRTAEAVEALNLAVAAAPQDSASARYLLFLVAVRAGDERNTRRLFGEFLAQEAALGKRTGDPLDVLPLLAAIKGQPWHEPVTRRAVTQLFLRTQRPHLARFNLEQHLRDQPETGGGWAILARLCLDTGRFERAGEAAQKAILEKPGDAVAYFTLGLAQGVLGQLDAARQSLIRSEAFKPRQPETHLALACLETRAGNRTKAAAHFAEAKRLGAELAARFEARPESFFHDAAALRALAGE